MARIARTLCTTVAAVLLGTSAFAADCTTDKEDKWDIEEAEIVSLYDCIQAKMVAGYTKGDNEVAGVYRDWTASQTRPGLAGPHGERLLNTYANEVAAEQYLKFAEEGFEMPVGSVLAKESFNIRKQKAVVGPLFIMTKVGADEAPDTAGWFYAGVLPNGKPMKIKQSFCHDCHVGWEAQDHMAYPLEETRVAATN